MLTAEQKERRKLGGSMIAAALGLSRWKTPRDAYLDVIGEAPEIEENEHMERGNFLEPALRAWTEKRLNTTFFVPKLPLLNPDEPFFSYSPDGLELDAMGALMEPNAIVNRVLEIKAPGPHAAHEWGEPGTDQVPPEYLLQGAWGLHVCGGKEAVFAALIGGELRLFRHVRDLELEKKLVLRATEFIENYVKPRIPPPAVYGDAKTIHVFHPREADKPYLAWNDLNDAQRSVVADYLRLKKVADEAYKEKDSREVLVQDIIADAPGLMGLPPELGFERIDWKTTKPGLNAGSWKVLGEEYLASLPPEEQEKKKLQVTAPGSRRFTAYKLKEKKK